MDTFRDNREMSAAASADNHDENEAANTDMHLGNQVYGVIQQDQEGVFNTNYYNMEVPYAYNDMGHTNTIPVSLANEAELFQQALTNTEHVSRLSSRVEFEGTNTIHGAGNVLGNPVNVYMWNQRDTAHSLTMGFDALREDREFLNIENNIIEANVNIHSPAALEVEWNNTNFFMNDRRIHFDEMRGYNNNVHFPTNEVYNHPVNRDQILVVAMLMNFIVGNSMQIRGNDEFRAPENSGDVNANGGNVYRNYAENTNNINASQNSTPNNNYASGETSNSQRWDNRNMSARPSTYVVRFRSYLELSQFLYDVIRDPNLISHAGAVPLTSNDIILFYDILRSAFTVTSNMRHYEHGEEIDLRLFSSNSATASDPSEFSSISNIDDLFTENVNRDRNGHINQNAHNNQESGMHHNFNSNAIRNVFYGQNINAHYNGNFNSFVSEPVSAMSANHIPLNRSVPVERNFTSPNLFEPVQHNTHFINTMGGSNVIARDTMPVTVSSQDTVGEHVPGRENRTAADPRETTGNPNDDTLVEDYYERKLRSTCAPFPNGSTVFIIDKSPNRDIMGRIIFLNKRSRDVTETHRRLVRSLGFYGNQRGEREYRRFLQEEALRNSIPEDLGPNITVVFRSSISAEGNGAASDAYNSEENFCVTIRMGPTSDYNDITGVQLRATYIADRELNFMFRSVFIGLSHFLVPHVLITEEFIAFYPRGTTVIRRCKFVGNGVVPVSEDTYPSEPNTYIWIRHPTYSHIESRVASSQFEGEDWAATSLTSLMERRRNLPSELALPTDINYDVLFTPTYNANVIEVTFYGNQNENPHHEMTHVHLDDNAVNSYEPIRTVIDVHVTDNETNMRVETRNNATIDHNIYTGGTGIEELETSVGSKSSESDITNAEAVETETDGMELRLRNELATSATEHSGGNEMQTGGNEVENVREEHVEVIEPVSNTVDNHITEMYSSGGNLSEIDMLDSHMSPNTAISESLVPHTASNPNNSLHVFEFQGANNSKFGDDWEAETINKNVMSNGDEAEAIRSDAGEGENGEGENGEGAIQDNNENGDGVEGEGNEDEDDNGNDHGEGSGSDEDGDKDGHEDGDKDGDEEENKDNEDNSENDDKEDNEDSNEDDDEEDNEENENDDEEDNEDNNENDEEEDNEDNNESDDKGNGNAGSIFEGDHTNEEGNDWHYRCNGNNVNKEEGPEERGENDDATRENGNSNGKARRMSISNNDDDSNGIDKEEKSVKNIKEDELSNSSDEGEEKKLKRLEQLKKELEEENRDAEELDEQMEFLDSLNDMFSAGDVSEKEKRKLEKEQEVREEKKEKADTEADKEIERILSNKDNTPLEVFNTTSIIHIEEVKKKFKKLSVLIHPDKCKNEKAGEAFNILRTAYEQLCQEDFREEFKQFYDIALQNVRKQMRKGHKGVERKGKEREESYMSKYLNQRQTPVETEEEHKLAVAECRRLMNELKERREYAEKCKMSNLQHIQEMEEEKMREEILKEEAQKKWNETKDHRINNWMQYKEKKSTDTREFHLFKSVGSKKEMRTHEEDQQDIKGKGEVNENVTKKKKENTNKRRKSHHDEKNEPQEETTVDRKKQKKM